MRFDFGDAAMLFLVPIFALLLIFSMPRIWTDSIGRMLFKFPRQIVALVLIGALYLVLFNHTPQGKECKRTTSPDGSYIAELCLLEWVPGSDSEYVGRIYDTKNGNLLIQRPFSAHSSDTQIAWYDDESMSFSIGGGEDNSGYITLPPSKWDRLLAARPRL
ncbi:hypothetical protein AAHK20_15090 [Trinickia sp. YCB016]